MTTATRAGLGLGVVLGLGGCPDPPAAPVEDAPTEPAVAVPDDDTFRREAHGRALAAFREQMRPALGLLDPVAAARVSAEPLQPRGFGAKSRAERRTALTTAAREAEGIRPQWLTPAARVALRTFQTALRRGQDELDHRPWRDDPRALVHAVEPYLDLVAERIALGKCDDGCGLAQLGPALQLGFEQIGAASVAARLAAREDLATLAAALPGWTAGLHPGHPLVDAGAQLSTTLDRLVVALDGATAPLTSRSPVPWTEPLAPTDPSAWVRRPEIWGVDRLQTWLDVHEAYGQPPKLVFARAESTVARLHAMLQRDAERIEPTPALPQPFDAAACAATWGPMADRVKAQAPQLTVDRDCGDALRTMPADVQTDADRVLHLIRRGVIEPTRIAQLANTADDIAMVHGRAAMAGQAHALGIALATAVGHGPAVMRAISAAHHDACRAAVAVWTHAELGPTEALTTTLASHGCTDVEDHVAAVLARPRRALQGLGLVLLGTGPADAAALDRYWWAPMGLVRDLALPPVPPVETTPSVRIEPL